MRPKYTKVRARSAKEGSATVGWSLAAPGPACFPVDKEDIAALPQAFEQLSGISLVPRVLEQANTRKRWRYLASFTSAVLAHLSGVAVPGRSVLSELERVRSRIETFTAITGPHWHSSTFGAAILPSAAHVQTRKHFPFQDLREFVSQNCCSAGLRRALLRPLALRRPPRQTTPPARTGPTRGRSSHSSPGATSSPAL